MSITFQSGLLAQNLPLPPELSTFRNTLPQMMDSAGVPGLSIAVIRDNIIHQQGFGFKNIQSQATVKENTIFEAASLSKPIFAYVVLKMVEAGKFDLDLPLVDYVSQDMLESRFFKRRITDRRVHIITARMVLTHSTGFPNWRPKGEDLQIEFMPGSKFSYSGEGFMFLQRVIEDISGRPLNRLAQMYVFDPLGMENSSFIWQEENKLLISNGHTADEKVMPFRKQKKAGAAYSLLTTPSDYSRFMLALMQGEGLRKDLRDDMLRPQMPTGYGKKQGFSWGLGIGVQETDEGKAIWHWGDNGIFKCYMMAIPAKKKGVVFFTNSIHGLSLGEKIISFTMGEVYPNFKYLEYDQYHSPIQLMSLAIARESVEDGLRVYHEIKSCGSNGEKPFPEESLTQLGYDLLDQEKLEAAIQVFKINATEFPNSWNVYDNLGEAYLRQGKEQLAIKYYKESLRLNPKNENGKKMLARILD